MASIIDHQRGTLWTPKGGLAVPGLSRKNVIINPNFKIWQRYTPASGVSGTPYSGYIADHWTAWTGNAYGNLYRGSTSAGYASWESLEGQIRQPNYYLVWINSAVAADQYCYLLHKAEDCTFCSGRTATLSFYGYLASGSISWTLAMNQNTSSGAYYSATVAPGSSNVFTLDTTPRRFSCTYNMPSLSGRSLTDGNNIYFYIYKYNPPAFTMYTWGWQLEPGPIATPFEEPPDEVTLRDCQRYYCKTYDKDTPPGTVTNVGSLWGCGMYSGGSTGQGAHSWRFPVPMRATPSLSYYTRASGTLGYWDQQVNVAPSTLYSSPEEVICNWGSGGQAVWYTGHIVAQAEMPY